MADPQKPDAFEALVAEWIGEIGTLEQKINNLPGALDKSLASTIASLNIAKENLEKQLKTLPDIADQEIARASKDAITPLANEVSLLAHKLAETSAITNRNKSYWMLSAGIFLCAITFGSTGYLLRMGQDDINVKQSLQKVEEAQQKASQAILLATNKANNAIEVANKNAGWMGTTEGIIAKEFFVNGGGMNAARCNSPVWDVVENKDGKYCIPQRRDIFGGDSKLYGWKIP
jgi:hypothetical protein